MKTYKGDYLQEIVFPLWGIGTGGIGLSGTGALVDWELTGRANKCTVNGYTHFAVKAERGGQVLDARVLAGDRTRGLSGDAGSSFQHSWGYGFGLSRATVAGLTHFEDVSFTDLFPTAQLDFADRHMPARIRMTAYNPMIPCDEDNSSLPAAFFMLDVTNTSELPTEYTVALSLGNPFRTTDGGYNAYYESDGLRGMFLSSRNYAPDTRGYGELTAVTDCGDVSFQEYWYRSGWFDDLTTYWREFSAPGRMKNRHYDDDLNRGKADSDDMSTLAAHITLQPGETRTVRFLLAWYFPIFEKYWSDPGAEWKHEYCRRFSCAQDVVRWCFANWDELYRKTCIFRDALQSSSMPPVVIEAAADTLAVLKGPTCLRLSDGSFWAFEGTAATRGSCEGTCEHVWGYQYALPMLYPRLARRLLETDYDYNMKPSGELMFRTMLPLGSGMWGKRACVDGQMGCVLRFYREWQRSGDDEWLRRHWPKVRRSLEYAWSPENQDLWDPEKSGVITGRQHHTLDVELFGPTAWLTGYYLAALKAAARIAEYLGETERAEEYRRIFEKGSARVDAELFNGEHYIQTIDLTDSTLLDRYRANDAGIDSYWNEEKNEIKYQLGDGCEIDQCVGQWHATLLGLGDIFDQEHRRTTACTLFRENFKSMRDMANPCRIFALNGEEGMIICSWAEGRYKPQIPVPYAEECMTGFEYAAAGFLLQEGLTDEALRVIKAIRDRYDGNKRNPYSEIECGASYARSMAAFSFTLTYSGSICDAPHHVLGFKPLGNILPMRAFWSAQDTWGSAAIDGKCACLQVEGSALTLCEFILPDGLRTVSAAVDGCDARFAQQGDRLIFAEPARIAHALELRFA